MFVKKSLILLAVAAALATCNSNQAEGPPVSGREKGVQPLTKHPAFDAATESVASSGFDANINVQALIKYKAAKGRFKEADLRDFFDNAMYKGNIISIIYWPNTSRPWHEFCTGSLNESEFNDSRQFYAANHDIVDDVSRKYGVPPELIVAIIGIKTNYGKNTGSFRVADALSTLALDYPHHAEFFQDELSELFLVAKEEKTDIFGFRDSYAGAMDMPQFMPSNFHKWVVDYDDNGHHDIWNSIGDVAASVANYMKAHGQQTGGKMAVPVTLDPTPQIQAIIDEQTALTRTVADFRGLSIVPMEDVADNKKAVLYRLEISPGIYEYCLGLNNFYAVWKYDHNRIYVTAVRDITNAVDPAGL